MSLFPSSEHFRPAIPQMPDWSFYELNVDRSKGRQGGPRASGACDPCKQSKVRCVFTIPGAKCRRCEHHGHECRVSGRKQKPRPPSHEELEERVRNKDDQILRLLRGGQYSTPSTSTTTTPTPPNLPDLPFWEKRTPKPDVDRMVAVWIAEARKRMVSVEEAVSRLRLDFPQRELNILDAGLVTWEEVQDLFNLFYEKINIFFTICDPVLHTPQRLIKTSHFLFTTICAVASHYYPSRSPTLYQDLLRATKRLASQALNLPKCIETAQAYLLLGVYHPPPRTFLEDRTFLFLGMGIRMATDLDLHLPEGMKGSDYTAGGDTSDALSREERERWKLNRARVWLNCYCNDRSISTQLGKPSMLLNGLGTGLGDVQRWWCSSPWNSPHDMHLCAYASLLNVVWRFHEVVVERAGSGAGPGSAERQPLDLSLVQSYADKIIELSNEWKQIFADRRPSGHFDPATTWRDNLWPFMVSYSKLVVLSIGLEDGMRQGLKEDNRFATQCVEAATDILTHVTGKLVKLGYLRYCVEAYFVFMGFAAAFLLKILRPKFSFMMRPGLAEQIICLVQRLSDVLDSEMVAVDHRHTPRLYARFLRGQLKVAKRFLNGGAGVGSGTEDPEGTISTTAEEDESVKAGGTMGAVRSVSEIRARTRQHPDVDINPGLVAAQGQEQRPATWRGHGPENSQPQLQLHTAQPSTTFQQLPGPHSHSYPPDVSPLYTHSLLPNPRSNHPQQSPTTLLLYPEARTNAPHHPHPHAQPQRLQLSQTSQGVESAPSQDEFQAQAYLQILNSEYQRMDVEMYAEHAAERMPGVEGGEGLGAGEMTLFSMAAITDPGFWQHAVMPGFGWVAPQIPAPASGGNSRARHDVWQGSERGVG